MSDNEKGSSILGDSLNPNKAGSPFLDGVRWGSGNTPSSSGVVDWSAAENAKKTSGASSVGHAVSIGKPIGINEILKGYNGPVFAAPSRGTSASDYDDASPLPETPSNPGFDYAHKVVMKFEGGYANNPSDKGGPTIYGIASRFHPQAFERVMGQYKNGEVDTARALARNFYKKEFWDKVVTPDMTAAQGLVMYDTAVNHGPELAKHLYRRFDGDPQGMIDGRRAVYNKIVADDPTQAQFLNGWTKRLGRLRAHSMALGDTPVSSQNIGGSDKEGVRVSVDDTPKAAVLPTQEKPKAIKGKTIVGDAGGSILDGTAGASFAQLSAQPTHDLVPKFMSVASANEEKYAGTSGRKVGLDAGHEVVALKQDGQEKKVGTQTVAVNTSPLQHFAYNMG